MPTIEITSPPLTPSARLGVAVRMTRWLADRGAVAAHVIVTFRAAEPMTYFAGGMPLSRYDDDRSRRESRQAPWASVVCHVSPDRDGTFHRDLAEELRAALGVSADPGHCVVRFEPTPPEHVHYRNGAAMTNAGPSLAGASPQEG